jgi:hypothetical protein
MKEYNPTEINTHPRLHKTLDSWLLDHSETGRFKQTLKQELENLSSGVLPLHQATQRGGKADDSNISALINSVTETDSELQIKVGVFFHEIMGGCSCGDEPPSENTYCDLLVSIDKATAAARFKVV